MKTGRLLDSAGCHGAPPPPQHTCGAPSPSSSPPVPALTHPLDPRLAAFLLLNPTSSTRQCPPAKDRGDLPLAGGTPCATASA